MPKNDHLTPASRTDLRNKPFFKSGGDKLTKPAPKLKGRTEHRLSDGAIIFLRGDGRDEQRIEAYERRNK